MNDRDERLAALLNRRDEVRARKTETRSPEIPINPDLFRPKTAVRIEPTPKTEAVETPQEKSGDDPKKADAPESTASRLLEAKRRARKNLE